MRLQLAFSSMVLTGCVLLGTEDWKARFGSAEETSEPTSDSQPPKDSGLTPADADGDGYDAADGDCDDTDPSIHPGADERCNLVDDDCDGAIDDSPIDPQTWRPDADGDGCGKVWGGVTACEGPAGTVANGMDCNDTDPTVHLGAEEICDAVDNDCDGEIDNDGACSDTCWSDMLSCDSTVNGAVNPDGESLLGTHSTYACGTPYADLSQQGPEVAVGFSCDTTGEVTVSLSDLNCDLDLYILDTACNTSAGCIDGSTNPSTNRESVSFACVAGTTYVIVVEAFGYSPGAGDDTCARSYAVFTLSFGGPGCL